MSVKSLSSRISRIETTRQDPEVIERQQLRWIASLSTEDAWEVVRGLNDEGSVRLVGHATLALVRRCLGVVEEV